MASSIYPQSLRNMRNIVGDGPPDIVLVRHLHLAKGDVSRAVNLYFDSPQPPSISSRGVSKDSVSENRTSLTQNCTLIRQDESNEDCEGDDVRPPSVPYSLTSDGDEVLQSMNVSREFKVVRQGADVSTFERPQETIDLLHHRPNPYVTGDLASRKPIANVVEAQNWWLLGDTSVSGYSTTKGSKLSSGQALDFNFPKTTASKFQGDIRKYWANKGKGGSGMSDIVRFSTQSAGEIGRLPSEWAKAVIPLVASKRVRVEGVCLHAPKNLQISSNIDIGIRFYVSSLLFSGPIEAKANATLSLNETTTGNPLSSLLRLLNLQPCKKASFTPEDFYSRKRSFDEDLQSSPAVPNPVLLPAAKRVRPAAEPSFGVDISKVGKVGGGEEEEQDAAVLSDSEINTMVGTSDRDHLEEREAPADLLSELRPYQKQALWWMYNLEQGSVSQESGKTLHPCWEAYQMPNKDNTYFYHNVFSGQASLKFPSALQLTRGGILADAMGLGKTVMTISLLLTNKGRGGSGSSLQSDPCQAEDELLRGPTSSDRDGLDPMAAGSRREGLQCYSRRGRRSKGGGTLIVCPMTLLSQWQSEIKAHSKEGSLSVYMYYGSSRGRQQLLDHDVVLTTYGVLTSEMNDEKLLETGPVHSIHWFRVVLDEAHSIKAYKSASARAVFHLVADRRWALTGTPIQNKLEDIFSLLHFLRVEPWANWGWWHKLIQLPHENNDSRSLKLLQGILKPLMLRRTKESTDRNGNLILVLPPADCQIIECHLSEEEKDFYDALHMKSKVKFEKFVAQGKVLHNYASILEMLLRLRQCCDHPFLVLSRGDTKEYADLDKLAKKFLGGAGNGSASALPNGARKELGSGADVSRHPTEGFVKNAIDEWTSGAKRECHICLEAMEDAVFTPCAHVYCRECLLTSFGASGRGACPECRQPVCKAELITAPQENRFQLDVEKNWTESCKVAALLAALEELRGMSEKSIVFSQWTAFLDLLQIPLKKRKFAFVRLDGTLTQAQREKAIEEFRSNAGVLVMLVSLKAGGVGINLTAANNAFLLDPWWNPAVEEQAIMRIHRIGQTKPVKIRRFIVKGTVEERMQAVQERKQQLVNGALTDSELKSARIDELKMLFR